MWKYLMGDLDSSPLDPEALTVLATTLHTNGPYPAGIGMVNSRRMQELGKQTKEMTMK